METHIVQDHKVRIDAYLHKNVLNHLSKTKIQNLIESGEITVKNQKTPLKTSYKLKQNEEILINKEAIKPKKEENFLLKKENLNLQIIFEDEDLLIVNKKSGMVVHPTEGKDESGTLVNGLLYHLGNVEKLSLKDTIRPGIVHRIDKYTSGLLVVAKNDESHNFLKEQLEEHTMIRSYIGLVINHLQNEKGTIDAPIGHNNTQNNQKLGSYTTSNDAKNPKKAITHYKLLKNYQFKEKKFSLVEFQLETGRTHQIRVHMSSISRPLIGDTLYGPKKGSQTFKVEGPILHAKQLGFVHPKTKKEVLFEAKIPEYFQSLLDKLTESD
eukprot:gene8581-406_t